MHLLPCPSCEHQISVSPAQAGDEIRCPECQQSVPIPKLGQLKLLPQAEENTAAHVEKSTKEVPVAGRLGFLFLGVVAVFALIIAGYSGLRWSMIDVPLTTEDHVSKYRTEYEKLNPAQLIREYEQMEEYGVDMPIPYNYKKIEIEKRTWGQSASVAGGIGGVAILGAIIVMMIRPRPS